MTLNPADFDALTFDCYGTLIDWEAGLLAALRPLLEKHDRFLSDEETLELYAEIEPAIQAEGVIAYRAVLRMVVYEFAARLGFGLDAGDAQALVKSMGEWPAFADSAEALRALQSRWRLAVIANVDDDLFALSARHLGVTFDAVITAQQVGCYKPDHRMFHAALERLALPRERVLHAAQSHFHDHVPAEELGWTSVWIDRRTGSDGSGATRPASAQPAARFENLRDLAVALEVLA